MPIVGFGIAVGDRSLGVQTDDPVGAVAAIEAAHRAALGVVGPGDRRPARGADVPITRCWDVLTVHRLLHGGWRTSIARCWAWIHGLSSDSLPTMGQLDLLGDHSDEGGDPDDPVRSDGHLRPEWVSDGWARDPDRLATWAGSHSPSRNDSGP